MGLAAVRDGLPPCRPRDRQRGEGALVMLAFGVGTLQSARVAMAFRTAAALDTNRALRITVSAAIAICARAIGAQPAVFAADGWCRMVPGSPVLH
jgi:sulfite exporter TauE/SafE